jgi:hypothetical protein
MRLLCVICSKNERTHIGIYGGEIVTLCDSQECWNKYKASRGDEARIMPHSPIGQFKKASEA